MLHDCYVFVAELFYPYVYCPRLIAKLDTENDAGVCGVTCLKGNTFALRTDKIIEIYEKLSSSVAYYTLCNTIDVTKLTSPNDIAACHLNDRLYISDSRNYGIWIIRKPFSSDAVVEHFVSMHSPQGLSVTSNGCVIATMEVPFNICVYSSDGRQLANIPLNPHITDVRQAVFSSDGHFIVCSGLSMTQKQSVAKIKNIGEQIQIEVSSSIIVCMMIDVAHKFSVLTAPTYNCLVNYII